MRRAIELSAQAIEQDGAWPYGAVVVKDGRVVGEGLNQSSRNCDPTSHGEIEAIRDACRKLGTTDLTDADLYSSCEPCPLCVSAMMIAGIGKLYYAATLEQSSRAIPGGRMPAIDMMRRELALPTSARAMRPSGSLPTSRFRSWRLGRGGACDVFRPAASAGPKIKRDHSHPQKKGDG